MVHTCVWNVVLNASLIWCTLEHQCRQYVCHKCLSLPGSLMSVNILNSLKPHLTSWYHLYYCILIELQKPLRSDRERKRTLISTFCLWKITFAGIYWRIVYYAKKLSFFQCSGNQYSMFVAILSICTIWFESIFNMIWNA